MRREEGRRFGVKLDRSGKEFNFSRTLQSYGMIYYSIHPDSDSRIRYEFQFGDVRLRTMHKSVGIREQVADQTYDPPALQFQISCEECRNRLGTRKVGALTWTLIDSSGMRLTRWQSRDPLA